MESTMATQEQNRLDAISQGQSWRRWGTYVSERAWGAVPEDYSPDGNAWNFFPHEHARMRAYRWHEDGLAGFCDDEQSLCLGLGLWNGKDLILKERLWGLAGGGVGNHGEDVKELYFYQDATPTHSYNRMRYLYPHAAYPFDRIAQENSDGNAPQETELQDILRDDFQAGRYFQVDIEYAKAGVDDILVRIRVTNMAGQPADIHVLPQIWYRNTWTWEGKPAPWQLKQLSKGQVATDAGHPRIPAQTWAVADQYGDRGTLLFTDNETNWRRLWPNDLAHPVRPAKDAFHIYLVPSEQQAQMTRTGQNLTIQNGLAVDAVRNDGAGTKAAALFKRTLAAKETWEIRIRLAPKTGAPADPFAGFTDTLQLRSDEADAFYNAVQSPSLSAEEKRVQRQAYAGLLWSRQFYRYDVNRWLTGDPTLLPKPDDQRKQRPNPKHPERKPGRNADWQHLDAGDVITMPDCWEYPWFAAWDLAFHSAAIAPIDPDWSKFQLLLLLRPYYLHPNGQIPAYEWEFSDVNPPVAGWASLAVYRRLQQGKQSPDAKDLDFLADVLAKLQINFTWWMNREDSEGDNIFQGGFLGLDNISILDRSSVPANVTLDQTDATAWMAMYAANLFEIAVELALQSRGSQYEDLAIYYLDHYVRIATVLRDPASVDPELESLWNEVDGFYYDHAYLGGGANDVEIRIRSVVGLVPLFASTLVPAAALKLPRLKQHIDWLQANRPQSVRALPEFFPATATPDGQPADRLLSLLPMDDSGSLVRVLNRVLDDRQFLSPQGVRSLSREHLAWPFQDSRLGPDPVWYQSGVSTGAAKIKGGNSNWRGPVWMPINYLIVQSLRTLHRYHGNTVQLTLTERAWQRTLTLDEAADELSRRLSSLFLPGPDSRRPINANDSLFDQPGWSDQVLFYEYFDGDTGKGLGANHQTGWTGLIAPLLEDGPSSSATAPIAQKPVIYQLVVRYFGNTNPTNKVDGTLAENGSGTFTDIDQAAIAEIKKLGATHVWLTGVLRQATLTDRPQLGLPADPPDICKGKAGSFYAVRDYFDVCADYCPGAVTAEQRLQQFRNLVARLHDAGLQAIIDLVPNHVSRNYGAANGHPNFGDDDDQSRFFARDNGFFYLATPPGQQLVLNGNVFAREDGGSGRTPKATGNNITQSTPPQDSWYETVKLNYGWNFATNQGEYWPIPRTWTVVDKILSFWQDQGVDGFRCDFAHYVPAEAWTWLISRARVRRPAYFFAEAYPNQGSGTPVQNLDQLVHAGFDAVYDSTTYEILKNMYLGRNGVDAWLHCIEDSATSRDHLVSYLENHDERRIASPLVDALSAGGNGAGSGFGAKEAGYQLAPLQFLHGRNPVMILNGQEVGEPGAGATGFKSDNGRTTIFDYWTMPEFAKWVNGHAYDGGGLAAAQKDLRTFYANLLKLCQDPAITTGEYASLPSNGMAGFVRWQPGKKRALLVIANLQTGPSSSFQIRLPALVASSAGLGATVQAKVLLGSPTILSVADPVNAGIQLQLANQRSAVVELG
jgi:glycosidase